MKKQNLLLMTLICLLATGCHKNNEEPSDTYDEGVEINGVVWATRNVGLPGTFADANNEPTVMYRWNSRVGWEWKTNEAKSTDGSTWRPNELPSGNWSKENDPCPPGWRMPTENDCSALCDEVEKLRDMHGDGNEHINACVKRFGFLRPTSAIVWDVHNVGHPTLKGDSDEALDLIDAIVIPTSVLDTIEPKYSSAGEKIA